MAGTRSLTDEEVTLVLSKLGNNRDRCLFILGLKTGFRISELLSLKVSDVYQNETVVNYVRIARCHMKGKRESREVPLHPMAQAALRSLLAEGKRLHPSEYLFQAHKPRGETKAISRVQGYQILKNAFVDAGLFGDQFATHSMRKTFARKVYAHTGNDIVATADALGHKGIGTTGKYLEVNKPAIQAAILAD